MEVINIISNNRINIIVITLIQYRLRAKDFQVGAHCAAEVVEHEQLRDPVGPQVFPRSTKAHRLSLLKRSRVDSSHAKLPLEVVIVDVGDQDLCST